MSFTLEQKVTVAFLVLDFVATRLMSARRKFLDKEVRWRLQGQTKTTRGEGKEKEPSHTLVSDE